MKRFLDCCYAAVVVAVLGSLAFIGVVALFLTLILVGVLGYHAIRALTELLNVLDLI